MSYIIDTHAHYDDEAFDKDREKILDSLSAAGIKQVINVGASMRGVKDTLSLSGSHSFVYAAIGVHPSETGDITEDDMAFIKDHAGDEKVVAIGEIGLDYHYLKLEEEAKKSGKSYDYDPDPSREHQQKWFIRQLEIARETKLPVIIHSREAAADTAFILKKENADKVGGVIHCYSYSKEAAKDYLDLGFYFGIGGVITFKNGKKLKETVSYVPMDRILLETDCPYLAPEPYRGERNCSLYLPNVVRAISQIKGISEEEVIEITSENARRLFALPREI